CVFIKIITGCVLSITFFTNDLVIPIFINAVEYHRFAVDMQNIAKHWCRLRQYFGLFLQIFIWNFRITNVYPKLSSLWCITPREIRHKIVTLLGINVVLRIINNLLQFNLRRVLTNNISHFLEAPERTWGYL